MEYVKSWDFLARPAKTLLAPSTTRKMTSSTPSATSRTILQTGWLRSWVSTSSTPSMQEQFVRASTAPTRLPRVPVGLLLSASRPSLTVSARLHTAKSNKNGTIGRLTQHRLQRLRHPRQRTPRRSPQAHPRRHRLQRRSSQRARHAQPRHQSLRHHPHHRRRPHRPLHARLPSRHLLP